MSIVVWLLAFQKLSFFVLNSVVFFLLLFVFRFQLKTVALEWGRNHQGKNPTLSAIRCLLIRFSFALVVMFCYCLLFLLCFTPVVTSSVQHSHTDQRIYRYI